MLKALFVKQGARAISSYPRRVKSLVLANKVLKTYTHFYFSVTELVLFNLLPRYAIQLPR